MLKERGLSLGKATLQFKLQERRRLHDGIVEWWNCVQTDINKCKIANWKEKSKSRADWGSALRKRR